MRLDGLVWDAGGRFALAVDAPVVVPPGDIVVLVAEQTTGCAVATALVDVLVGLALPVSGKVRVEGSRRLEGRPDPRIVALVPAGGGLLPQRTVAQNIGYGVRGGHSAASRRRRVTELAELFGVAAVLGVRPHRLSPSQRLHVAAARALGSGPHAVVVEDRAGQPGCGPMTALIAARDVTVIVVTDSAIRARALTERVIPVRQLGPPPAPDPPPNHRRRLNRHRLVPGWTEAPPTGPVATGPVATGPVATGPVATGPVATGAALTGAALTGAALTGAALTGQVATGQVAGPAVAVPAPAGPGSGLAGGSAGQPDEQSAAEREGVG